MLTAVRGEEFCSFIKNNPNKQLSNFSHFRESLITSGEGVDVVRGRIIMQSCKEFPQSFAKEKERGV